VAINITHNETPSHMNWHFVQNVLSCKPQPQNEMVHVGDDLCFDFVIPSKLGIKAFYLDRTGENSGDLVIHSLKELIVTVMREWGAR